MNVVPAQQGLWFAAILFVLGLAGVLARRDLIFVLMSIEVMLNASGLAFISAASRWSRADGQVMFVFILSMAASEVAVGLALAFQLYHRIKTLNTDAADRMRG